MSSNVCVFKCVILCRTAHSCNKNKHTGRGSRIFLVGMSFVKHCNPTGRCIAHLPAVANTRSETTWSSRTVLGTSLRSFVLHFVLYLPLHIFSSDNSHVLIHIFAMQLVCAYLTWGQLLFPWKQIKRKQILQEIDIPPEGKNTSELEKWFWIVKIKKINTHFSHTHVRKLKCPKLQYGSQDHLLRCVTPSGHANPVWCKHGRSIETICRGDVLYLGI